ncbi:hypothetical protein R5R35_014123 [Gryllus longicercus]|uniref:Uncharacterized protein n=1 Tax=Gryllus longicercus TaxID=2509291 RepID=A0AAN9Z2L1_9ORTH
MHLLNSTDREVDVRDNPIRVVSKRQFVLYLDNSGAHIVWYKNCTCFDVSCGNATLKFCAEEEGEVEENECWVTIARMSSTSTISTTTTSTEQLSVARITEGNATRAEGVNESVAGAGAGAGADSTGDAAAVEQAAFLGLSGSKLSFLGFLLLTFLALLVANCVAGHPVVDERWWEETLRGDRVVS